MRKSIFLGCLYACAVSTVLVACGDDSGGGAAGGGAAGSTPTSGTGGTAGGMMVMDDPINADCPIKQGPFVGDYAMKGPCCYRKSNTSRLATATGGKATLEYRLTYFVPNNHDKTISGITINAATISRWDAEEQHLLFRFIVPYEGGEFKAGMGTAQIGAGRYNCDGTYSFYTETAAQNTPAVMDPKRWATSPVPITVDPTKTTYQEQVHTIWATNINRNVTYLPYILQSAGKPLEWEAASQGFTITKMPPLKDALNCVGTRPDMDRWVPGGETVSYQRLDLNSKSAINILANISLAQLQAFGSGIGAMKDDPKYSPTTAKRCKPGEPDCQWLKLPDSLCPVTPDEINSWGCHVGDPMNEDMAKTNCTPEKPTGVLDPDKAAGTSEGQCCDPLATGGALPACNAYRLLSDFTAAAAEITDMPSDKLQPECPVM